MCAKVPVRHRPSLGRGRTLVPDAYMILAGSPLPAYCALTLADDNRLIVEWPVWNFHANDFDFTATFAQHCTGWLYLIVRSGRHGLPLWQQVQIFVISSSL